MKPLNLFFSGLLFVAVVITGTGWYGALVSDYASLNATEKINTTEFGHLEIMEEINQTQSEMESGLKSQIGNIPFIGGVLVQVFGALQLVSSFLLSMWDALTIGTMLITGLTEIIPFPIHPTIIRLIQISVIMLFIGSIVYLILNRRVS
jgi:hypothetical protein